MAAPKKSATKTMASSCGRLLQGAAMPISTPHVKASRVKKDWVCSAGMLSRCPPQKWSVREALP